MVGDNNHDECADIIARNPDVDFKPGLTGIEVYHKIYEGTWWDRNLNNFPSKYLDDCRGKLGHILVSIVLNNSNTSYRLDDFGKNPQIYQPHYIREEGYPNRDWYIAGMTAITKVRVERVVEVDKDVE